MYRVYWVTAEGRSGEQSFDEESDADQFYLYMYQMKRTTVRKFEHDRLMQEGRID